MVRCSVLVYVIVVMILWLMSIVILVVMFD